MWRRSRHAVPPPRAGGSHRPSPKWKRNLICMDSFHRGVQVKVSWPGTACRDLKQQKLRGDRCGGDGREMEGRGMEGMEGEGEMMEGTGGRWRGRGWRGEGDGGEMEGDGRMEGMEGRRWREGEG